MQIAEVYEQDGKSQKIFEDDPCCVSRGFHYLQHLHPF